MIKMHELAFPVLLIAGEHHIIKYDHPDRGHLAMKKLSKAEQTILLKYNTFMVDSNGKTYRLLDVKLLKMMWWKLLFGAKIPTYIAELTFEKLPDQDFESLRDTLFELILRKKWYTANHEYKREFMEWFPAQKSIQEMIKNISCYGNPFE